MRLIAAQSLGSLIFWGPPGTGKTLLGMHFLEEGLENDETVLFIHGEESREEILSNGFAVNITPAVDASSIS